MPYWRKRLLHNPMLANQSLYLGAAMPLVGAVIQERQPGGAFALFALTLATCLYTLVAVPTMSDLNRGLWQSTPVLIGLVPAALVLGAQATAKGYRSFSSRSLVCRGCALKVCGGRALDLAAGRFQMRHAPKERIRTCAEAEAIAAVAEGFSGPLSIKVEDKRQLPPRLHDLPFLQKLCGSRFGWSAAKTLEVAQELYEGVRQGQRMRFRR